MQAGIGSGASLREVAERRGRPVVHETLEVLAVIAIVGFVIGRQLMGEPLRGKRVVLLPAVLIVIGFADLTSDGRHPQAADVLCLVISAVIAAGIGAGQGSVLRLESRNGALWGQMPLRGLWLWIALVASRVVMTLVASGLHAHLAASTAGIVLILGVNRLAQAAVVFPRALAAGIPFAPERDGGSFLAGFPGQPAAAQDGPLAGTDWKSSVRELAGRLGSR
jgi:hypothetical protein